MATNPIFLIISSVDTATTNLVDITYTYTNGTRFVRSHPRGILHWILRVFVFYFHRICLGDWYTRLVLVDDITNSLFSRHTLAYRPGCLVVAAHDGLFVVARILCVAGLAPTTATTTAKGTSLDSSANHLLDYLLCLVLDHGVALLVSTALWAILSEW